MLLGLQGYLAHKKAPISLGTPYGPGHNPTIVSWKVVLSYERGTPVTRSWNPGEVLSNLKPLDSPLTSAEGLRFEGWGLGLRVSGVGLRA